MTQQDSELRYNKVLPGLQQCWKDSNGCALDRGAKKGRHGTKYTEEQEDAELLQDENSSQVGHRLNVQPSVIKGGDMRKYQLEGLNWLIHLFDNGINGILADEMVRHGRLVCPPAVHHMHRPLW